MTLNELKIRVKTEIRAELAAASLSISDLHDDSIAQWANEEVINTILVLGDKRHFPALNVIDSSLTFSPFAGGSAALPTDFWWPETKKSQALLSSLISLKVTTSTSSKRNVRIVDSAEFARYDNSNFVLTANEGLPIGMIADKVYIKPATITTGYLDYIKKHQTIDSSHGTQFDNIGDNVLTALVISRYYAFRELPDMQANAMAKAGSYV